MSTKIFVRDLQHKTHSVTIDQGWTIAELRQHIQRTIGINEAIILTWNEANLVETATVADYSIQKGVIIISKPVDGGRSDK